MCSFKMLGVSWPPCGWKQLSNIEYSTGQSMIKDPASARVAGLSYTIEASPIYQKNGVRHFIYAVQIDGWEYTIHNESREFSALSFILRDKPDPNAPKHFYISDIKTKSRPVRNTERSAHRTVMAALFLIRQINNAAVPDIDRILRLYKIHPTQRSLYDIDSVRHDSMRCGLPSRNYEESEIEGF